MIKVFGHISPDTDTTGSAIVWAWYLNKHRSEPATPYVLGPLNKEASFVLSRWKTPEPELLETINPGEDVAIVDTNNPQELPINIGEANIISIIDHHKLSGLSTKSPTEVIVKPLASTATLLYDLMGEDNQNLPENISGILLSCILSDTLAFRSPTTTSHDKDVAEKLAKKLKININSYADELFSAKSDVSDFTDTGLIHIDSKKFEVGSKNIRVSVIETTNPKSILDRKSGLVSAIKGILAEEKDTFDVLLFVIDIFKEEATVLTYNQFTKDLFANSFGVSVDSDTKILPGVVSRKKQIIPSLKLPPGY